MLTLFEHLRRRPGAGGSAVVAKVIEDARPYRHLFPLPWPPDFDRYH
jgi:hypothetical protein